MWKGALDKLNADRAHERTFTTLEERTKDWWLDQRVCAYEAFLILFIFSIWEARNRDIFNNSWTPHDITISLLISKVQETKRDVATTKTIIVKSPEINREIPWAFFDGAAQDNRCGGWCYTVS